MKKLFLSLSLVLISLFAVGYGYALFQDTVAAKDNKFYAALFDLELSTTDNTGDNLAEPDAGFWSSETTATWVSDLDWLPGDTVSSRLFLRNNAEIDAESVYMTFTGRTYSGASPEFFDEVVNLTAAWYDRNADGIQSPGEDLLPALAAAYDANGGSLTLQELYDGMDLVHQGTAFDLESGSEVLPGSNTDGAIGGNAGSGKGLFLTWQFDPNAGVEYQEAWVDFDIEFTAEQATN